MSLRARKEGGDKPGGCASGKKEGMGFFKSKREMLVMKSEEVCGWKVWFLAIDSFQCYNTGAIGD